MLGHTLVLSLVHAKSGCGFFSSLSSSTFFAWEEEERRFEPVITGFGPFFPSFKKRVKDQKSEMKRILVACANERTRVRPGMPSGTTLVVAVLRMIPTSLFQ